ncbi:MAG: hypothetical protein ABRQ37_19395 [Candidatus Eremiobacterota bacterium]
MDTERETRNYVSQLVNIIPDKELPLARSFLEFLIEKSACKEKGIIPVTNHSIRAKDFIGKFAHLPGGSEEFMKEKHEENEREERKFQKRLL